MDSLGKTAMMMNFDFLSSDPYDLALLATAVLLLLFGGILLLRRSWRKDDPFPFEQKPLGTESQRVWLPLVQAAVRGRYDVLPAVRLDDLLQVKPSPGDKPARLAAGRLAGHRVDFVLLAPGTLDPLAAVQLQGTGQQDAFFRAALLAAGLPVLFLPPKPVPAVDELRDLLQKELGNEALPREADPLDEWVLGTPGPELVAGEEWSLGEAGALGGLQVASGPAAGPWPPCPECGSERVARQVNRGRYAGKSVLVCSRYPACQHLQPVGQRPS